MNRLLFFNFELVLIEVILLSGTFAHHGHGHGPHNGLKCCKIEPSAAHIQGMKQFVQSCTSEIGKYDNSSYIKFK